MNPPARPPSQTGQAKPILAVRVLLLNNSMSHFSIHIRHSFRINELAPLNPRTRIAVLGVESTVRVLVVPRQQPDRRYGGGIFFAWFLSNLDTWPFSQAFEYSNCSRLCSFSNE